MSIHNLNELRFFLTKVLIISKNFKNNNTGTKNYNLANKIWQSFLAWVESNKNSKYWICLVRQFAS